MIIMLKTSQSQTKLTVCVHVRVCVCVCVVCLHLDLLEVRNQSLFYFLKFLFPTYFRLHWVFVAEHGLFLVGASGDYSLVVVLPGGSQFWLHVGNCFFDLLLLLYAYSVAHLGDPAPLLDCKLKCLCSAHGERFVPAHLWTEEIHTPLLNAGHSLGNSSPDWRPSHFIPHFISLSILPFDFSSSLSLSLCSIKEPGIQTPIRWLFWGASLPSSRSVGSPIKVSSLARHLVSRIHWPVVRRAEWARTR